HRRPRRRARREGLPLERESGVPRREAGFRRAGARGPRARRLPPARAHRLLLGRRRLGAEPPRPEPLRLAPRFLGQDREEDAEGVNGRSRVLLWAPVVLLLAYEFYLSSRSASALPRIFFFPQADKVMHAGYFGLMGGCAVRAARWGERWSTRRTF